jgi:CheY-like chemotaxis protein
LSPPYSVEASSSAAAPILAVDDMPANLLALGAALEPLGVQLVTSTSGAEAVELAASQRFAVILLDYMMPGLDGLATLKLMKERQVRTPVILITALSPEPSLLARAYELGAIDFLEKPISPVVLRGKVSAFIKLHQNLQQQRTQDLQRDAAEREMSMLVEALTPPIEAMARVLQAETHEPAVVLDAFTAHVMQLEAAAASLADSLREQPLKLSSGLAEEVDMAELCRKAVERHRLTHADCVIEFASESSLGAGAPGLLIGNRARLEQAIGLLLFLATKRGPRFVVAVEPRKTRIEISVSDHAAPIPERSLTFCFRPSSLRSPTSTSTMQNVLALVRAIAQAHGGSAEAASSSERTIFKLSLPIAPEAGR